MLNVALPASFATAWTLSEWKPDYIKIDEDDSGRYGNVGITPEALFDRFSIARRAPAQTYYVDTATGNDTTGDGSSGNKWKTIHKAVTQANAAGTPTKIIVTAGEYVRTENPSNGNTVLPTVDIAFIATGGRVVTGTFETFTNPTADGTQTNTYSATLANVSRIMDRKVLDRFGNYTELTFVSTPAICNRTPNSWAYSGGVYYINRADGAAPTATNTRLYRSNVGTVKVTSPVSIFFGGASDNDGWDFEHGNSTAVFHYAPTTTPSTNKAVICTNCSFRYGGGPNAHTAVNGVSVDSIHGIAAFFNCRADANTVDGFNGHNTASTTAVPHILAVNCTATDNGRLTNQSCNGWTLHEGIPGLDVAGIYQSNRGGSVRCINTSKALLAGTTIANDQGDIAQGGTIAPTAVRVDDTAQIWMDGVRLDMPAGTISLHAASVGAAIRYRNMNPLRRATIATGTITAGF